MQKRKFEVTNMEISNEKLHTSNVHWRPLPIWYDEAKFGIFIHWGVYSVPCFADCKVTNSISRPCAEWYLRHLQSPKKDEFATRNHHFSKYGSTFKYAQFAPMFKAANWNSDK